MAPRKAPKSAPPPAREAFARAFREAMTRNNVRNIDIVNRFGVDSSYVSQWRSGDRPIPADKAEELGLLLGVLPETISEPFHRKRVGLTIPSTAEAGSRQVLVDMAGHTKIERLADFPAPDGPQFLILPTFLVRAKSGHAALENVRWVLNPSRAMEPEISSGALVLVDASVRTHDAVIDGVTYAYSLRNRPDIRRILIRKDHWSVTGYGKHSDLTDVYESELQSLEICGLVLGSF